MNRKYTTIDYDWLTCPTGDPFADVGGYVIKCLSEKYPEKDIMELIEFITKIYVNKWEGKINTFFLNSPITQPAFKGQIKVSKTIEYFESLIGEKSTHELGFCRISGRREKLFKAGRDNSLMSGSGTFVNFHHNFQEGIMLSKEIIIRLFFIPFGSVLLGGKIVVIQSNINEINEFFVKNNCQENFECLSKSISESVLKSQYNIPSGALFNFVDNLLNYKIKEATDEWKNIMLTLYHFSNFGASPEIAIYRLPANVFRFYTKCNNIRIKDDWMRFLYGHYSNTKLKNAKYNESTFNYEISKKEEIEKIEFKDYKSWRNIILDNLLNNKSLTIFFLNWIRKHKLNFTIVELYQKEIHNMKKETLDKIKELAVFLTNADIEIIKKTIKALDGYKSAYELRRFFVKKVVVKNYADGNSNAIISVDDMVYYLFPDDISWRDIRDVLLVAIYEELHKKNILNANIEEDDIEEDDNMSN